MSFVLVTTENQTEQLVRQLRYWVGDVVSDTYADNQLAQALYDVFEIPFLARVGITTTLTDPASTTDPLATDDELTERQKMIWVLYAALLLLRPESIESARTSGSIRSAAGSISLTEVYDNLREQIALIEGELSNLLLEETGTGLIAFVNLSSLGGRTNPAT